VLVTVSLSTNRKVARFDHCCPRFHLATSIQKLIVFRTYIYTLQYKSAEHSKLYYRKLKTDIYIAISVACRSKIFYIEKYADIDSNLQM